MLMPSFVAKLFIFSFILFIPLKGIALDMPTSANSVADSLGITARSYIVVNKTTGEVLMSKNPDLLWTPASLTKLVTILVVLDNKPKMTKAVAMVKADEVGGARINTKAGIKYTVKDLFYSALLPSANNATRALARSTGLSEVQFVEKMNQKAKDLGAVNTHFLEPTGINENNVTTAADYAKISKVAFENPVIRQIAGSSKYNFKALNSTKYSNSLKNTNKLLSDADITMISGKTGYLVESKYNFATEVKDRFGNESIVVLLGSENPVTQFAETKQLALLAGFAKTFIAVFPPQTTVAGTSTIISGIR
jgi:serine-type D-Ala-D-Ala carboxypeptidase (penicillin-binding protein 5/6)